ncbi:hypothetical protein Tco_0297216, partial [Tanacetum coccineum]
LDFEELIFRSNCTSTHDKSSPIDITLILQDKGVSMVVEYHELNLCYLDSLSQRPPPQFYCNPMKGNEGDGKCAADKMGMLL